MLKNTYFGFGEDKSAMMQGRIESTLDKIISSNNRLMTEKEWVLELLLEGYEPEKVEGYTYYSSRIDGYTKPKTLYKLQKDSGYQEVSKTVYDFAHHLINNRLVDRVRAVEYATKEKEEQEREEKEEEELREKELELKRQKEIEDKKERGERMEKMRDEFRKIGSRLMTEEVQEIFRKTVADEVEGEGFTEAEIGEYKEGIIKVYEEDIGNQRYIENRVSYLFGTGNGEINMRNSNNQLQYRLFENLFGVKEGDPQITITSKVRAFYDGRKYKGRN